MDISKNVEILSVEQRPMDGEELRRAGGSKKARVYMWPEGWSVMKDLVARANRDAEDVKEVNRVRIRLERALMAEVLKRAGLPEQKASYSQRAGCSCQCSPGFVLAQSWGSDVFVKYRVKVAA